MAVSYFLKLDGITGETQDAQHAGSLDVHSWSWGGSNPANLTGGSGAGAGKVMLSDISLMISLDNSSVALFRDLASGTHIATAVLSGVKAADASTPYLSITFTGVVVSSLQFSASSDVPSGALSLAYRSVQIQYGAPGSGSAAGWDLSANKAV